MSPVVTLNNRQYEVAPGTELRMLLQPDQLRGIQDRSLVVVDKHGIYDASSPLSDGMRLELRRPKNSEMIDIAKGMSALVFSECRLTENRIHNQLACFGMACRSTDSRSFAHKLIQDMVRANSIPDLIVWPSDELRALDELRFGNRTKKPEFLAIGENRGVRCLRMEDLLSEEQIATRLLEALGKI